MARTYRYNADDFGSMSRKDFKALKRKAKKKQKQTKRRTEERREVYEGTSE